ncbi:MAG: RidA family protein [Acetobacteraceae bacterium]|nr:RidA family protein [Acetobacteraceae bacterium]
MTATIRFVNPPDLPAPAANYSMTAEVSGATRWLFVSGQLPIAADGSVPEALADQAALVVSHLRAALAHAGMDEANIVKLTTYLAAREARAPWQAARDAWLAGRTPPASTQVIVAGLADPRCAIEVDLVAAA